MAPSSQPNKIGSSIDEEDYYGIKSDRKARKPLVEKKRRARINESLQELRALIADTDLQSKMENAEVLEMTVKRVEHVLRNRSQEADTFNQEANERFAAGYIQCMHEVHTYVSNCPGIDATVAAELLNHLLECMPLKEENFQEMLVDLLSDPSGNSSTWAASEGICAALTSLGVRSIASLSPVPSITSSEDFCSDLDETDGEQSSNCLDIDNPEIQISTTAYFKSMWRPW